MHYVFNEGKSFDCEWNHRLSINRQEQWVKTFFEVEFQYFLLPSISQDFAKFYFTQDLKFRENILKLKLRLHKNFKHRKSFENQHQKLIYRMKYLYPNFIVTAKNILL